MKVKLATQLVSRSSAVAMSVLRRCGYEQFEHSEGMEEFLLIFDRYEERTQFTEKSHFQIPSSFNF